MSEVQGPEVEVRQAKVIALHSKGLNQSEIAAKLGVDQSTVSRDLKELRKQSRKVIERRVVKNAWFEFYRWDAGLDEVMKKAWEVAEDEKTTPRAKVKALAFLVKCYDNRLNTLVGGPDMGYDAFEHILDMHAKAGIYRPDKKIKRPQENEG